MRTNERMSDELHGSFRRSRWPDRLHRDLVFGGTANGHVPELDGLDRA